MNDQTPSLSSDAFPAAVTPQANPAILAPRIVAFYVAGHPVQCGNDLGSSNPKFLFTDTVADIPEVIATFMADNPGAIRKSDPMRRENLHTPKAASLDFDTDA